MDTQLRNTAQASETVDTALTPETILSTLQITAPAGLVAVEGIVIRMNEYPKDHPRVMYGELRDEMGDNVIQFKCPIHRSPRQVGDVAIIQGGLSFISKKERAIRITGDCISLRKPIEKYHHPILSQPTHAKIRLDEFINQHGPDALLVIGTPIAIRDVRTGLQEALQRDCSLNIEQGNFNAPAELLAIAQKALSGKIRGILFARGGNDIDTLQHWDNPRFIDQLGELKCPIYTAIGHSNQLFLVEKFVSDDFFTTPTAAGHAIGRALKAKADKAHLLARLSSLEQQRDAAMKGGQQQNNTQKQLKFALIAIVILAFLLWLKS